jgi:2-dehydropantoate 2-reductase
MTSMGTDLLRGNRLELPWFAGKVVELGRRHGIPTPVNGFIYAALKPYVSGRDLEHTRSPRRSRHPLCL